MQNLFCSNVDARKIIDRRFYTKLKQIQNAEDIIIKLLDKLIDGENCDEFLKLLQEDEIHEYLPRLKEIIKTQGTLVSVCLVCLGFSRDQDADMFTFA